jgi:hypothetical protein
MYPVAVVLQYIYNTILYNTQKTQNNTYTLKTTHNTKITNTVHTKLQTQCTQNYKHKVST